MEKFVHMIMIVAIGVGAVTAVALWWQGRPMKEILETTSAALFGQIPEGLQPTATISLLIASYAMADKKVLVRKLDAVETLGCCDIVCSDKTGTLTAGVMTVTHFVLVDQKDNKNVQLVSANVPETRRTMSIESDGDGPTPGQHQQNDDESQGLLANDHLNNSNNQAGNSPPGSNLGTATSFGAGAGDSMGSSANAGMMLKSFEAMKKTNQNVDTSKMGIEQDLEDLTVAALLNTSVMCTELVEFPGMLKGNAEGLRKFLHGSPTETALYLSALKNYAGAFFEGSATPVTHAMASVNADFVKAFEIPFNSTNKYMLTVHKRKDRVSSATGDRYMVVIKGAPDKIMAKLAEHSGKMETTEYLKEMKTEWNALMATGKRVIMFAKQELTLEASATGYTFEGT